MASATFVNLCKQAHSNPKLIFLYEQTPGLMVDWSEYIQSIGEIRRDINMSAGTMSITLDNTDGLFDEFLTDHQSLTKKIQIKMTFVGSAIYSANTISFADLAPNTDYINDSAYGFITAGFVAGMPITISGSDLNDKTVTIKSVMAGTLELEATDELTTEAAGDDIILETEEICLYTGFVDSAVMDYKAGLITLNCKDRIGTLLENCVEAITTGAGGTISPVIWNYISITGAIRYLAHVVSAIVWDLLTEYGDLDNDASTSNRDIDYTSFLAWAGEVDAGGYTIYDIGVNSYGDTVGSLVMRIMQLTESISWQGADGKLKFKCSLQTIAGQTYTKSLASDLQWQASMEDRINSIACKWNYDFSADLWGSDVSGLAYDSEFYGPMQSPWTYQHDSVEDRTVFHNSSASAINYMNERLKRTGAPPRTFDVTTGILGFVEDIGNEIVLSGFYDSPYDAIKIYIDEISLNVAHWQARIKGHFLWTAGEL